MVISSSGQKQHLIVTHTSFLSTPQCYPSLKCYHGYHYSLTVIVGICTSMLPHLSVVQTLILPHTSISSKLLMYMSQCYPVPLYCLSVVVGIHISMANRLQQRGNALGSLSLTYSRQGKYFGCHY